MFSWLFAHFSGDPKGYYSDRPASNRIRHPLLQVDDLRVVLARQRRPADAADAEDEPGAAQVHLRLGAGRPAAANGHFGLDIRGQLWSDLCPTPERNRRRPGRT